MTQDRSIPIRRILCPVDFSEPSREALRLAVDMAQRYGAALTLLHVIAPPGYTLPDGMIPASPLMVTELLDRVGHRLDEWRREAERLGAVDVSTESVEGGAAQEIPRFAADRRFDLVVMGTHGRTGIQHALLGSVAERVVRRAPCPVLTVRPSTSPAEPAHPTA